MRTRIDEHLREEARLWNLRFSCGDCAHYAPAEPLPLLTLRVHAADSEPPAAATSWPAAAASGTCGEGFPTEPHEQDDLSGRVEVIFCKAFELR